MEVPSYKTAKRVVLYTGPVAGGLLEEDPALGALRRGGAEVVPVLWQRPTDHLGPGAAEDVHSRS